MKKVKPILIYCHGYGSSSKTYKVQRLRDLGYEVYAWCFDEETPQESLVELTKKIDDVLLSYPESPQSLVFIGTSLGAWVAQNLASVYGAESILINPCIDPSYELPKISVSPSIANQYTRMMHRGLKDKWIISEEDEVIDFLRYYQFLSEEKNITLVKGTTHRFNGPEFENLVVESLKELGYES